MTHSPVDAPRLSRPLVGIPACTRDLGELPFHVVGDKYVRAVAEGAGALPVLIPALGPRLPLAELVAGLDGLLVTGSPSNVEPARYGGRPDVACPPHDPARDATTLPLIRAALDAGLPVLAICRGIQELNVALGGTLHPRVHEVAGLADHRNGDYGPAHVVRLTPGGLLARLSDAAEIVVNSLHGQGIDRLADGLVVEAVAPDGLIEAVRCERSSTFTLGTQWHPEWCFQDDAVSRALFAAFGAAAAERAAARRGASA